MTKEREDVVVEREKAAPMRLHSSDDVTSAAVGIASDEQNQRHERRHDPYRRGRAQEGTDPGPSLPYRGQIHQEQQCRACEQD